MNVEAILTGLVVLLEIILILGSVYNWEVGRISVYVIATRYSLDGTGTNSGGGEIFRTCSDRPWDPPSSWRMGNGFLSPGKGRGVKRQGQSVNHPPPHSAEVKERIGL
jgi:hypothetical protein